MSSTMTYDEMLDAAACEALGANTPADAAVYSGQVPDDRVRRTERELRETVARLAAASPHVAPPADLRGRLLQATAPATFRMEDYRKATQDGGRFYRWGFYAAMLFLMAGAYYNIGLQSKLKQAGQVLSAQAAQVQERDQALAAFVNPNATQLHLIDEKTNQRYGEAVIDSKTNTAVVILPDKMVPPNQTVHLSMSNSNVPLKTVLVRTSGDAIPPLPGKSVDTAIRIKTMQPDAHVAQMATTN
jgi:hypothetical protein